MITRERLQEIKTTYGLYAKQELIAEIERLGAATDDLEHWEHSCWHCANPDAGDPERHEHEPQGGHWHHYLDPGDGLPSPCKNSEQLERIFQEQIKRNAELEAACREKDERLHELRNSRDERLEEVAQKYELQTQQIVAQNEYYLKVIAGEVALQPPAFIDNVARVAALEATVARLQLEFAILVEDHKKCRAVVVELGTREQQLKQEVERLTRELAEVGKHLDLALPKAARACVIEAENARLREMLAKVVQCTHSDLEYNHLHVLKEAEAALRGENQ